MILSRAMSCGNGCLVHPLIISMFTPYHHHPCFPTQQMTFMPERRFLLLIAGGEYSLDVQQGPNSFKLLLLTNSDFRGFHSWVDTDVLVSAIMGPLSFHANWSESRAKRLPAQREKIYKLFSKLFFERKNKSYHTRAQNYNLPQLWRLQVRWSSRWNGYQPSASIYMVQKMIFSSLNHLIAKTKLYLIDQAPTQLAVWSATATEYKLFRPQKRDPDLEGVLALCHEKLQSKTQWLLDSWLHSLQMSTNVGCRTVYLRLWTVNNVL